MVNKGDLGVFVANDLKWSKQVFEQSCRANNLLGYIRRNTRFIRSTDVMRSVYLTLVRPFFGYATEILVPQSIELKYIDLARAKSEASVSKLMIKAIKI